MVLADFGGRDQLMYKIIGADGREYGPISADHLRNWIAEGRATAETRVQAEGAAQWKLLTEYLEFAPALARALPSRPAPGLIYLSPTPRTNSMALAAMLMGILSMTCGVCCCCCCYGLPFNVLGVIFALIALSQIKNDPQSQQGRSLAIVGLVLCLLSFVMSAVSLVFGVALNAPEIVHKIQRL
jgi:Domain of unknown function (DUF4190)/GYF domain 2